MLIWDRRFFFTFTVSKFRKKSCKNNIFSVKLRQKVNNKNDKEMRSKIDEISNRWKESKGI